MNITEETIHYVSDLTKFNLTEEEKEKAKMDMSEILNYIDIMNDVDTKNVSPTSHIFSKQNVFREDIVTNGLDTKEILFNAPVKNHECFIVPKTVE